MARVAKFGDSHPAVSWVRDRLVLERLEEPDTLVTVRLMIRRSEYSVGHAKYRDDREQNTCHSGEHVRRTESQRAPWSARGS